MGSYSSVSSRRFEIKSDLPECLFLKLDVVFPPHI